MASDAEAGDIAPEIVAIGISFGNSYSSIAYNTTEGKTEVIANEEGDRFIPSVLSYIEGEEYHGTQAKSQLVRNSKNTITSFRDYLGKDFASIDPTPSHASAHPQKHDSTVAFSVQEGSDSDKPSTLTLHEVTKRHIQRLAASASDYLGKKVNAAVIAIPTDFKDSQKEALTAASKAAGIEVLQLIHEPTSALLAYDARSESLSSEPKDKNIVVADIGGTRTDIAVIASRGGIYSILSTQHDFHSSSGTSLDAVLTDHFAKEFLKKHKSDPRSNPRSLAKLKLEAEATKKALSLGGNATLSIESLYQGVDYTSTINRTRYELLASKIFTSIASLVRDAIASADLDVLDIDEVILSGGSSHTPRLTTTFQSLFPSSTRILSPSTLPTAIDPSSLNARGAAIQASLIADYETEDVEQSCHPAVTVTPHLLKTVGVLLVSEDPKRGVFTALLEKDTAVPARRTAVLSVPKGGGSVLVKVCEAERGIKVTKPEPKSKTTKTSEDDDDDDFSDDDDDEPEEVREKIWDVKAVLSEAAVRDVKKGGKVEVTVNVGRDLACTVTAREVGGKGGVRGQLKGGEGAENGSA